MQKIYFLLITLVIVSCNTKIRYIGKTLSPTGKVDIYVSEESIKKPFDYIGKGYVGGFGTHNPEKIQQKSIRVARQKGADAVLITDFFIPDYGSATISSMHLADSVGKTLITTGNTIISPTTTTGFNILFLRYNK
jgi:hypothetical protein